MPLGLDFLEISDIVVYGDNDRAIVDLVFRHDDALADATEITHVVSVKVRVNLREGATISELQQAALEKAVDVLNRTVAVCGDKTAQELLREARADTDRRQRQFDKEQAAFIQEALSSRT